MKRVCFFSGDITRSGGTEKVACQIMSGLCDTFDVSVISLTEENATAFFSLPEQIKRTVLFPTQPSGTRQFFQIVSRVRSYVKDNHIDALIDVDTILDMFSVPALRGLPVKLIAWEHFNFYETMGNRLRVPIRKHMTRRADCVVTLTKEDQANYQRNFEGKTRIEQIYNPIELSKSGEPYAIDSKTIISAGRLARQKGFDYLIDIAEKVFAKHPDWEWLILGEGEERASLEEKIKEKRLIQVKLMGRVSNVADYLRKSAIYVMTSRYEGFPLVLVEAKAARLPVVSFDCKTGPAELIRDGENGFLVPCFDVESIAEKINELIEQPKLRQALSEGALLDTDKMDYGGIVSQWKKLIFEVLIYDGEKTH